MRIALIGSLEWPAYRETVIRESLAQIRPLSIERVTVMTTKPSRGAVVAAEKMIRSTYGWDIEHDNFEVKDETNESEIWSRYMRMLAFEVDVVMAYLVAEEVDGPEMRFLRHVNELNEAGENNIAIRSFT